MTDHALLALAARCEAIQARWPALPWRLICELARPAP